MCTFWTTYTKTVRKFADPPPRRQILYAIDTWEEGLVYETSRGHGAIIHARNTDWHTYIIVNTPCTCRDIYVGMMTCGQLDIRSFLNVFHPNPFPHTFFTTESSLQLMCLYMYLHLFWKTGTRRNYRDDSGDDEDDHISFVWTDDGYNDACY